MASVVLAYKGKSLDDVLKMFRVFHSDTKTYRARNKGEAMDYIIQKTPLAVLIDEAIEGGLDICRKIKGNLELNSIFTIYFVSAGQSVNPQNTSVDKWYVKGSYHPENVVENIPRLIKKSARH